jgi:transposase-like protein
MNTPSINRCKKHRFLVEIISHAVWLYFRFCLSDRDVEELLFARGILVTYEAIRKWYLKFGQAYANQLRRRPPKCGDKWHLDEVFLTINGDGTTSGGPSIRMATSWIFWSKAAGIRKPPRRSSANFSRA